MFIFGCTNAGKTSEYEQRDRDSIGTSGTYNELTTSIKINTYLPSHKPASRNHKYDHVSKMFYR